MVSSHFWKQNHGYIIITLYVKNTDMIDKNKCVSYHNFLLVRDLEVNFRLVGNLLGSLGIVQRRKGLNTCQDKNVVQFKTH
jgi:hypothetical protein